MLGAERIKRSKTGSKIPIGSVKVVGLSLE